MIAIDAVGFMIADGKLYPNVGLVFRAETTKDFTTISISDGDSNMLQIPLTDDIKEELRRVL